MPGLDDIHMVIGVGLRIMGNVFRIITVIIKRVIGELLDDKRRFLCQNTDFKPGKKVIFFGIIRIIIKRVIGELLDDMLK